MEINELIFFGMFGMIIEICFTAIRDLIFKKNVSLAGHTSLWMFPIYAIGLSHGFDLIMYLIDDDVIRWLSYPFWIWGVEAAIGIPTSNRGIRIWDYSYLPGWLHWRGIVSFAHYPLWVVFGVLIESIK